MRAQCKSPEICPIQEGQSIFSRVIAPSRSYGQNRSDPGRGIACLQPDFLQWGALGNLEAHLDRFGQSQSA